MLTREGSCRAGTSAALMGYLVFQGVGPDWGSCWRVVDGGIPGEPIGTEHLGERGACVVMVMIIRQPLELLYLTRKESVEEEKTGRA